MKKLALFTCQLSLIPILYRINLKFALIIIRLEGQGLFKSKNTNFILLRRGFSCVIN